MRIEGLLWNCLARMFALVLAVMALAGASATAYASAGNTGLKIIAWYGAGNLSKSEYGRDTVILFNPTQSAITMDNWSLQTGGASGSFTTIYKLPVATIPAGGFYAITGSASTYISSSGCTATAHSCETNYAYDYQLDTIEGTTSATQNSLSSTQVVAALVSQQTSIGTTCATALASTALVDMVGVNAVDGSAAVACYAGGGPAPYTPNALNASSGTTTVHGIVYAFATVRRNRCSDTFNNDVDFALGYIDFENSLSTPKPCPAGNQLQVNPVATPNGVALKGTFVLTAQVAPVSAGLTVTADLTSLGSTYSATTPMYDDGTNGDAVAGDGTYTATVTAPATYPASGPGTVPGIDVTVTDASGNTALGMAALGLGTTVPGPGNNNIEIITWYGAGNLSGAQYAHDTVILFNPTAAPITMNNWSLQTGGATGAFSSVTYKLPVVTIPAGGFYAIAGSGVNYISSAGCTSTNTVSPCNAPTGYAFYDYQLKNIQKTETATDNDLSSTAVTVALVNNQTALGSDCPVGNPHLVDLVGIGAFDGSSPVTCYAGLASASYVPKLNVANMDGVLYPYATIRANPCSNQFDNSKDFILGYITWVNSSSTPHPCSPGVPLTVTASANPNSVGVSEAVTITAKVMPATSPVSSNINVSADLSNFGLSTTAQLYDDGTHGDKLAGDDIFTLGTTIASGVVGQVPGLAVTATDVQGNKAQAQVPFTVLAGTIALSANTTSATIPAGGAARFVLTAQAAHGYGGILNIQCAGSPNTNNLGYPVATECVLSPPELTVVTNGTATVNLGIAAGTTTSAGPALSLPIALITVLSLGVLTLGKGRRKRLPAVLLAAAVSVLTLSASGCGKNGGLANTNAAPGTYTFVVTATDSNLATITSSVTLTVVVQ